jgi:hypothetical protein
MKRWLMTVGAVLAVCAAGCKKEEPMPTPPARTDSKPAATSNADAMKPRLEGVNKLIAEKKWDEAEAALKTVEAEKWPEAEQKQVAAARKSLDEGRAATKADDAAAKQPEVNVAVPQK